ncbi:serine/threonine/tyrosine protein kinase MPS1 KNAG_0K01740 [Huiozyma naganishii CBS 8797]|uniref:Protein kinase domain-containing protein n=1 Tax=Huiozyma naganishii (strain ATCC MYA-139 / BCRC 22969 / CBS 8797 / KCTC 17520 / NBRC 10181 / NCYC 3082 / Yp74L-3) TaxID=1071383 RepID=J7SA89_HUIN7|nr:hypothetical protein KNAG_0K01740 [Kazachstania naganishii CBS 8797]CCK72539.1 hypothetical protein KNAG_0K01740 [Kazachstania naganishii CBS 8797]
MSRYLSQDRRGADGNIEGAGSLSRSTSTIRSMVDASDDEEDEDNIIGPPKLSDFGSNLLNESANHSGTFTKFRGLGMAHSPRVTQRIDGPGGNNIVSHRNGSSPSSSSIFGSTVYNPARPSSMTTVNNLKHEDSSRISTVKNDVLNRTLERRRLSRTASSLSNPPTVNSIDLKDHEVNIEKIKQTIRDETTSKLLERRAKRFLNLERRNRLGPAKRTSMTSSLITSEMDDLLIQRDAKGEVEQQDREMTPQVDYSNIVFGDLNPFQYVNKYNIPMEELPQISKVYIEKRKEENRRVALRKHSSSSLNVVSNSSQYWANKGNYDDKSEENEKPVADLLGPAIRHSDQTGTSGPLPPRTPVQLNESNHNVMKQELPAHNNENYNVNKLIRKREVLANLNVNQKEPELKKPKNNLEQLDKPAIIKRVEIQEPKPSKKNTSIVINNEEYEKIELLGSGGSSKVYKVRDSSKKVFALKRVAIDMFEESSVESFKGEIALLEKLKNQERVVQLYNYALESSVLYLIMECGDYDLSVMLRERLNKPLDTEFVRYYAREISHCVKVVHDVGIVHSDLKPANFIFVKGTLKIIDFGIANAVPEHTVNIYRETQIGTPNYMAPEALVAMNYTNGESNVSRWKVGKPSDVWSLGCIIYQMVYGKPPYASFQGNDRIRAIIKPSVKIEYPSVKEGVTVPNSIIELIKVCLNRDPNKRVDVDGMLNSTFLSPILVSEAFVRDLVKNAVEYGIKQGDVSITTIDALANDVIEKLSEYRI